MLCVLYHVGVYLLNKTGTIGRAEGFGFNEIFYEMLNNCRFIVIWNVNFLIYILNKLYRVKLTYENKQLANFSAQRLLLVLSLNKLDNVN